MTNISIDNLDFLIKNNTAFIIKTVSDVTGRYISLEHDDEFSIGLIAFSEAVKRYDESKGNFFPFAKLVIESRLKSYLAAENKYSDMASLDYLAELGFEAADPKEDKLELRLEIEAYKEELNYFGLTFESLIEAAPKHIDTRHTAFKVAKASSTNDEIIFKTYETRRLPIRLVSIFTKVSEKIIKHSKQFILATMIVFYKEYSEIIAWIKNTR